jgi:hypothetical protein
MVSIMLTEFNLLDLQALPPQNLQSPGAVASPFDGEFLTSDEFAFQPQTQQNPRTLLASASNT